MCGDEWMLESLLRSYAEGELGGKDPRDELPVIGILGQHPSHEV